MHSTMADRLRARCRQFGLNAGQVAERAGVNRSFVYDIMRARSEKPNLEKLERVASVLKVERDWLLSGLGQVEGEPPIAFDPDEQFVEVPYVDVRPAMGGGAAAEVEPLHGRPYHFQRWWIRHELGAHPDALRIMRVEGDSMTPTLHAGDTVLVDMGRRAPTPPGIFILHDGMGLVAKRLEHIPNTDPPRVRIVSDNAIYSPYESTAEEVNIIGRIRWYAREI